uniref:MP n=1 Tax=Silene betaflexivirus 1 TaxID=2794409 RepID=A0A7T5QZA5_9VIRU|nr:MP [Silene betaflexivirus 1]
MSIIKTNEFNFNSDSDSLKIDAIGSGAIYGDANFMHPKVLKCIRRFESTIKVHGGNFGGDVVADFPIIDGDEFRWINGQSKEYGYVHFGAIVICINPLFPNANKVQGKVTVFDQTMLSPEQGHIASYDVNFENGPAVFLLQPAHCLSSTDPNLQSCFKIFLRFPELSKFEGRELFGVDVGVLFRMSNTSRVFRNLQATSGWSQQEITGCTLAGFDEELQRKILCTPCARIEPFRVDCKKGSRGVFLPKRSSRRRSYKAYPKPGLCEEVNQSFRIKNESSDSPVGDTDDSRPLETNLGKFRSSSVRIDKTRIELPGEYECTGGFERRNSCSSSEVPLGQFRGPRSRSRGVPSGRRAPHGEQPGDI